jgi:Ca2+-binding EF-hand superfamily protein
MVEMPMSMRRTFTALAALLLMATGAHAQTAAPAPARQANVPRDFLSLDTDGDGLITQDEFRKYRVKRFRGLDKNKDGWVTVEEFAPPRYSTAQRPAGGTQAAPRPALRDPMFVSLDQNSDDRLSEDEFVAAGVEAINTLDEDKDGSITVTEWEKAPRAVRGKLLR